MSPVQFGLILPGDALDKSRRHLYAEDVARLLSVAKGHFHSAWFLDHLQFRDLDVLEGWTALTYLSALHPELHWGHTVICQSFRNPALLAKMASTLQFLSGGRFILGIGAGGNENEHQAYGYNFPSGSERVEQLDETLHILKSMWTQERTTFQGKHYSVSGVWCEPKPIPIPPIMVGAFGPRMLRLTARHADWWNVSSTSIKDYRAYLQELDRACQEVGRDPKTLRRTWSGGCLCAANKQEIERLGAKRRQLGEDFAHQPNEDLVGTPAQLIEQMQAFIEMGVDYFMVDCGGFPELTTIEMLINEVFPALAR